MKKIFFLIVLFASVQFVGAQPKIEFEKTTHDYGSIKEDAGLAKTEFKFTNTGDKPLILNNVRASCGCTTPKWTREPVAPGKTGSIEVSYNPKNRPGAFTKSVNVYSNSSPSITVLTIKGKVEPRELTLEEKYPRVMGDTRWKTNYLNFGSVLNTDTVTKELEIWNPSDKPVVMGIYRTPASMDVSFEPDTIQPKEFGKMVIEFRAPERNVYGRVYDRIYLKINNERDNTYSVGSSLNIQEDFSHLTEEELKNAPVAKIDKNIFDFGTINEGEKVEHVFKLSNNGKRDLLIRNVKASCGCTAVKHENTVKPGETTDISVVFNSRGKRGRQNKSITITTNDPKNPTIVLRVMGTVNKK
jgi:hypothetical protein